MRGNQFPVLLLFFLTFITTLSSQAQTGGECQGSCSNGSGDVTVNLVQKCMCIKGSPCFKIDIGTAGPDMTTSGTGKITDDVAGAKYQSIPGSQSTGYDKDAMKTGIEANSAVGKWIHKTRNCKPGGTPSTLGCIGVPCNQWPLMKKQANKTMVICGSSAAAGANPKGGTQQGGRD